MWSRRVLAFLVVVALTGAACGGDTPDDAAESTTTTAAVSTTSAATETAAPTSTTSTTTMAAPPPVPARCGDAEPVAVVDATGDGANESVLVLTVDGGQALVVCDSAGDEIGSVSLDYGPWYVATVDVEPDGVTELFLGATDVGDAPGSLGTTLHHVAVRDGSIEVIAEGGRGLWISWSSGATCVDLTGEGRRQLVSVFLDTDPDDPEVTLFGQVVAAIRAGDEDPVPGQGRTLRPLIESDTRLLGTFTCGGDPVEIVRVAPPAEICAVEGQSDPSTVVDLDGDGLDDVVAMGFLDHGQTLRGERFGSPSVVACLATGEVDELGFGGMGEVFVVGEGPDGRPLVWTGGTTVSAAFVSPVVWRDGRLDFVRLADGSPFGLADGYTAPAAQDRFARSGCGDVDGDGVDEFIQVVGVRQTDATSWTWERSTWRLIDGVAELLSSDSGPLNVDEYVEGYDTVAELVPDTCWLADG